MGADIHAHMEIKWDGEWLYYSPVDIGRNYHLFARMADMGRCHDIDPIAENKGIPEDASKMARIHCDRWGRNGHSHSWLNSQEICQLFDEFTVISSPRHKDFDFLDEFPGLYLFGSSFKGFFKYPEEAPKNLEDFRLVFWFDN